MKLFADEILRLADMYRVASEAHFVQGLTMARPPGDWPRPEHLIRPNSPTFASIGLRYLNAVRPNSAGVGDISDYVQRCAGKRFSPNMCSQAMARLVDTEKAVAVGRGRWKAATRFPKQANANRGIRPEINGPGLRSEVRRLILAYGPMEITELVAWVSASFSIGGRDPINNVHTILGKTPDIHYWTGVGYVLIDLVHLEPSIRAGLRLRRAGAEGATLGEGALHSTETRETIAMLAQRMARARAADHDSAEGPGPAGVERPDRSA